MDFLKNEVHAAIYYAGLFDGEGSVGLYMMGTKKTGQKYITLSAKLTNSDSRPLLYLMDTLGGSIENNRASEKNIGWVDVFSWRLYADKAYTFLNWIYPYTIIKKDQIEVVNDFWLYYEPFKQNKYNRPDDQIIAAYIAKMKNLKRGK